MSESSPKIAHLRDRLYVREDDCTEAICSQYEFSVVIGVDPITKEPVTMPVNHYERIPLSLDESYLAFNRGDLRKLKQVFHEFTIVDERLEVSMKAKLKMKFPPGKTWKTYQYPAVEALLQSDFGLLQAPPRSGKTVILAGTICAERQKTIVFAHQVDLLRQLLDTFEEFTNLKEIKTPEAPVVGIAEDWGDFDKLDVVLCTKQTFDNVINRPRAEIVQRMFGFVACDEAHWVNAEVYSKLINRFWAKKRLGVTATPHKKSGMEIIVDGIIGPVVHLITREEINQLPMEVTTVMTGVYLEKKLGHVHAINALVKHEKRNDLLLRWMEKDVKAGHSIVAVTDRKGHSTKLVQSLQDRGIPAVAFNGNFNNQDVRKQILDLMRSGKAKVMVAMRQMVTGLDIPCADCFYNLLPSANAVLRGEFQGEGGYEQQCTRVLTPFPGKTKGLVRDFVDSYPGSYACLKARQKTYDKLNATVVRNSDHVQENEPIIEMGTSKSTEF